MKLEGFIIGEVVYWFDQPIITQFFYGNIKRIEFFNMYPNEFEPSTHDKIIAIWHIKLKQLA